MKEKPFQIFLHIQKTGGITLQRLLRSKWNPLHRRIISSVRRKFDSSVPVNHFENFKMADRYYIGHNCFGIHRFLPAPAEYITFLREPVSRILSLYTYSKTNPTAYYHQHAKDKTLEEFALHTPLMELDNGQTRFVAGDEHDTFINRTPIGQADQRLYDQAIRNIETSFSFIGLTERFEESVLMMARLYHWQNPYHLKLNESKEGKRTEGIALELKERIKARNHLDVQLYEHVQHQFQARLVKMNITPTDIEMFKKQNALYNQAFMPFYSVYDRTKAVVTGKRFRP
jgi:hypothetical protein